MRFQRRYGQFGQLDPVSQAQIQLNRTTPGTADWFTAQAALSAALGQKGTAPATSTTSFTDVASGINAILGPLATIGTSVLASQMNRGSTQKANPQAPIIIQAPAQQAPASSNTGLIVVAALGIGALVVIGLMLKK